MIRWGRLALGSSHLRGIARRLGWGVGDQAVSSLSNFLLGVFVVRSLGASDFGAFALAYLTYSLILNASRGLSTDPLLVRYSGAEITVWRRVVASASGTAIVVGTVAGLVCIAVGMLLPPPLSGAFVGLGIGLPGLLLQDSWRFAFFAIGRGAQSLLNDLVWMFLLVGCLLSLHVTGRTTVFNCLLVFGLTATIAAALGLLQSKVVPRPRETPQWVHTHRDLGVRYLLENTTGSGAAQLRAMSLGVIAGLTAVGDVRAAEMLMGPFLVILMGVSQVAVPEASGVLVRHGMRHLRRFCFVLGGTQALAAALWGGALILLLPDGLGEWLLGPTWFAASELVLPVTLAIVWACFTVAAGAGLRARGAASRSLKAQLISCALYLSGGIVGALVAGASGTCWAAAGTAFVGALVWWDQLRRATAEELTTSTLAVASALPAGVTT